MKIRFYFDYSDYRSYLMLHTLKVLDDIPVEIEWIALDAYSLRALSGCEAPMQSPGEREYLKQEALIFLFDKASDVSYNNASVLNTHFNSHFLPYIRIKAKLF